VTVSSAVLNCIIIKCYLRYAVPFSFHCSHFNVMGNELGLFTLCAVWHLTKSVRAALATKSGPHVFAANTSF